MSALPSKKFKMNSNNVSADIILELATRYKNGTATIDDLKELVDIVANPKPETIEINIIPPHEK